MKIIMTVGLPASGKSTWAKQYVRENPGTIRFNNDEFSYMTTGWDDGRSFAPMDASYLRLMRRAAIEAAEFRGVDIVLDNTNLSPHATTEAIMSASSADIEHVFFEESYKTCLMRNDQRWNPIPNSVIEQMAKQYNDTYDWIEYEKDFDTGRHPR